MGKLTTAQRRQRRIRALVRAGAERFGETSDSLSGEVAAMRIRKLIRAEFSNMSEQTIERSLRNRERYRSSLGITASAKRDARSGKFVPGRAK